MADMSAIQEKLRALLDEERGLREVIDRKPAWFALLLRQLELAVGDQPIIYLGAATASAPSSVTLRVGIFTDHTVVAAEVVDDNTAGAQVVTRVESRSGLLRFELSGGTELGGDLTKAFEASGTIEIVKLVASATLKAAVKATVNGKAGIKATLEVLYVKGYELKVSP